MFNCEETDIRVWYAFLIRWHNPSLEEPYTEPSYYLDIYIGLRPFADNNYEDVVSVYNQRISPEEVEVLRHILEDNSVEDWNGFQGLSDIDNLDFYFILLIRTDSDNHFHAHGYRETPENFNAVFPLLADIFMDMAIKYADDTADFNKVPSIFDVAPFLFDD